VSLFVFLADAGQWRVGPNGAHGFDFNIVFHKMDRMGLTPEAYQQMEADILTMQTSALKCMRARKG
jgi:hypothetical protein